VTGLIGPNGAGKSTLFNIIAGALPPTSGRVLLEGRDITGMKPHRLFDMGVVRTFQIPHELGRMTVLENLYVPALALGKSQRTVEIHERAMEVLEFLTLGHLRNEYARALSGGQQKLLELGRLLMLDPNIIILDEPFAGVHPRLLEIIYGYIRRVNENGTAIIIISHQMDSIFSLCRRLLVLNYGDLIADDTPDKVKVDPVVIEAYLGADEDRTDTGQSTKIQTDTNHG